ncbi:MAG TPA: serine/threonine-protein kinase [Polyangiaceae bacterium]|nr:serine/threonine-protein kinase [Polyangiaceae bacterium]
MDEASGTLPPGFEFGAYVIGACVGKGGMARVYRAEHRALRKPVALKVVSGALLQRPDWRHRFLREGQAAAAVKHPNVVDITDVGVWQGRPYLVMELLQGEDLEQYLARHGLLSESELARLMIPVIAGLATAHESGVVHRDLKPSNVFLARGPDGEIVPKLLDFGISKLTSRLEDLDPASTPVGELMGSPLYMSPEAVRGAREQTPQSDQYSLGVVLYECVTGRAPFRADSLLEVLDAVASGTFDPPRVHRSDLSPELERTILRAMSAEPGARFASVREIGRALCQCADQRTRLLWMPSFGLAEPVESPTLAVVGSAALRTAAPVHLPASSSARPGALPWVALGLLGLAALGYWGRARWKPDPTGALEPKVQALQPPAPAAALPVAQPASEGAAPESEPPAPPRRAPEPTRAAAVEASSKAARAPAAVERRSPERAPPREARQRASAAPPEPPALRATPAEASPPHPARSPRAAVLGPNRAPILD